MTNFCYRCGNLCQLSLDKSYLIKFGHCWSCHKEDREKEENFPVGEDRETAGIVFEDRRQ